MVKFFSISIISVLILINFSEHSFAEKWILFYTAQDEEKYYFDRENIQKPGKKIVRVRQKKVIVEKDKERELEVVQIEIDCEKKTYKIPGDDKKDLKDVPPKPIKSPSRMEVLFDNVCYLK